MPTSAQSSPKVKRKPRKTPKSPPKSATIDFTVYDRVAGLRYSHPDGRVYWTSSRAVRRAGFSPAVVAKWISRDLGQQDPGKTEFGVTTFGVVLHTILGLDRAHAYPNTIIHPLFDADCAGRA